jgi:signal transduction histidine kinase
MASRPGEEAGSARVWCSFHSSLMRSTTPKRLPRSSRWYSIDRRLPFFIALLLVAAVGVLAAGAYRAVEKTLLETASARMEASAGPLASLLSESAVQRQAQVTAMAADPVLRRYLEEPSEAARDVWVAALAGPLEEPQTMAVELWSPDGELLAAGYSEEGRLQATAGEPPSAAGPGPIRVEQGTAFYEVAAEVGGGQGGGPARWLLVRRRLSSARAAKQLGGLIGRDARLLLGNLRGGAWTDLRGPAAPPLEDDSIEAGRANILAGGQRRLGVATAVPATPWMLWVDTPRSTALQSAHDFLGQLSVTAFALLVLGGLVTYGLSRHVTRPLDQLTAAAEGLAGGDLEAAVPVHRRDEVGRLARSFDRMRHQVVEARARLEQRVAERTEELREALTSLREAQEELVRQERLATLGQLSSGVGHELRNPLAVMTNALYYLDLVLEEATPEVREYLGILRHQVGLSEKIVTDLLDFARIKPPERQELPLPALAEQQLERLDLSNGLEVRRDFPGDLPAVYCDPVQVGQVVLNLLTNAAQAMGDSGGVLTLSARTVDPGTVELEVRDAGPGVPTELRDRIFEPLFTTKARGIGLGLAVSRSLAEANGGSLALAASDGPGATFVLRLPTTPELGP